MIGPKSRTICIASGRFAECVHLCGPTCGYIRRVGCNHIVYRTGVTHDCGHQFCKHYGRMFPQIGPHRCRHSANLPEAIQMVLDFGPITGTYRDPHNIY